MGHSKMLFNSSAAQKKSYFFLLVIAQAANAPLVQIRSLEWSLQTGILLNHIVIHRSVSSHLVYRNISNNNSALVLSGRGRFASPYGLGLACRFATGSLPGYLVGLNDLCGGEWLHTVDINNQYTTESLISTVISHGKVYLCINNARFNIFTLKLML